MSHCVLARDSGIRLHEARLKDITRANAILLIHEQSLVISVKH